MPTPNSPLNIMSKKRRQAVIEDLQNLLKSCYEALDEVWDPSGEGSEGFDCMADSIKRVGKALGITKELDEAVEEHEALVAEREEDEQ